MLLVTSGDPESLLLNWNWYFSHITWFFCTIII